MKISTRGRYGLKTMAEIALGYGDTKCVSLGTVARRQGLSENYLERIIAPLKQAGIVKSVRGAGGGYELCRPPDEITVGDILRVLEGSLAPADCLESAGVSCGSGDCGACATKPVFERLFQSVNDVVDSVTLKDLII